jgi:hypothetical protein
MCSLILLSFPSSQGGSFLDMVSSQRTHKTITFHFTPCPSQSNRNKMQLSNLLHEQWPVYRQEGWREPALPYLQATLLFILAVYLWELYLDLRQRRRLRQGARTKQLPQELHAVVAELDSQPHPAAAVRDKQDAKDADGNKGNWR